MSLVEYYDPDGLFSAVSPLLLQHLPLRNLHWKSPSRPLRSIASLQVNFVEANSDRSSVEILRSSEGNREASNVAQPTDESSSKTHIHAEKARRHQIPGLRQTPFLKLFLLRCDDNDTYKDSSRKILRDWVNSNTVSSQSTSAVNKQDNHDAFEWLILHVVLPDTAAASQPRWSKKFSAGEDKALKEKSSKSGHWPGKGSSSVLERLRADFNSTSKSSPDRIAQIRLQKDVVPASMLPALPAVGTSTVVETQLEQENAWSDFISKMKNYILSSFDLRVSQYEEDIHERDAQRALPGWNFCTFFVLKEGLARAFESVGLIEDALVGYDELSLGLDSRLHEQLADPSKNSAPSFLSFTPDLQSQLRKFCKSASNEEKPQSREPEQYTHPLSTSRKDYRQLIVSNNISVFDLRCYVFARQMQILLKLAKIQNTSSETGRTNQRTSLNANEYKNGTFNGTIGNIPALRDLHVRVMPFVVSMSRLMRKDLETGAEADSFTSTHLTEVIDFMLHTWAFSLLQQVTDDTYSVEITNRCKDAESISHVASNRKDTTNMRRLSMPLYSQSRNSVSTLSFEEPDQASKDREIGSNSPARSNDLSTIAGYRADFRLSQRTSLAILAQGSRATPIRGNTYQAPGRSQGSITAFRVTNVQRVLESYRILFHSTLYNSLRSKEEYSQAYEHFTVQAIDLYRFAGRKNTTQKLIADLAAAKLGNGDPVEAANLFNKLLPASAGPRLSSMDKSLLYMYSDCLKSLHRKDEYIRVVLALISKTAHERRMRLEKSNPVAWYSSKDDHRDLQLHESMFMMLTRSSADLTYDVSVPLLDYFALPITDSTITLCEDKDGFELGIKLQQYIAESIVIDSVRIRMVDALDGQSKELWIASTNEIKLNQSLTYLRLYSNITTYSSFIVDKVEVRAANIVFTHEMMSKTGPLTPLHFHGSRISDNVKSVKASTIVCYPRANAFDIMTSRTKRRLLNSRKSFTMTLKCGEQPITSIKLLLRSASAGLRLHTSEAEALRGNVEILKKDLPGEIILGPLSSFSTASVKIPYDVEHNLAELTFRLEARYETHGEEFLFLSKPVIRVAPSLKVNVQEIYKENLLILRCMFKTLTGHPILLQDVQLSGAGALGVEKRTTEWLPTVASVQQSPYEIYTLPSDANFEAVISRSNLLLEVAYTTLEDRFYEDVVQRFETALKKSSFQPLARLLLPSLKACLSVGMTMKHYETITLIGECDLPSFDEMGWDTLISSLEEGVRSELVEWLRGWHDDNQDISLINIGSLEHHKVVEEEPQDEQLIISVEITGLDFLCSASIDFVDRSRFNEQGLGIAAVGEALDAELLIRHTRKWSRNAKLKQEVAAAMGFVYEIHAPSDVWLVGGAQTGRFSAEDGESFKLKIMLVPLRAGTIVLPTVNVRLWQPDENTSASKYSCETDCTSQCQSLAVIEDVHSATIGLGAGGYLEKGMTLLESTAR